MYQDKYLCFGIIFNHAKFLKDLTCRFLATPFSTIFLFNVLAHRYQKHRKKSSNRDKADCALKSINIPDCTYNENKRKASSVICSFQDFPIRGSAGFCSSMSSSQPGAWKINDFELCFLLSCLSRVPSPLLV